MSIVIDYILNKKKTIEGYDDDVDDNSFIKWYKKTAEGSYWILWKVVWMLVSFYAAWLSWECNTSMGYNIYSKIFFSFVAWAFGIMYLIVYALFRSDVCNSNRNISNPLTNKFQINKMVWI